MFNRKKKKTGVQTPEFISKVSMPPVKPPKPPTSGSNARKPNPNYVPPASVIVNCGHQPTYTSTQNPPDTLSSLLKTTSLQILPNDIGTVTYACTYSTPCGWCTKWDKKCDKKIGCGNDNKPKRGLRANVSVYDEAVTPCVNCEKRGEDIDYCCICWAHNFESLKQRRKPMTNLEIIKYLATNNTTRLAELLDDIYCSAWNCGAYAQRNIEENKISELEMEFSDSKWLEQEANTNFFFDCELEEWSKAINLENE